MRFNRGMTAVEMSWRETVPKMDAASCIDAMSANAKNVVKRK
jgi:hypothetical protein